ncbi:MAG TPA: hypothetical protein DCS93_40585 [Microscillaceae bacterium]|nr:hypothetical protein [Microscillaceae bacterium]
MRAKILIRQTWLWVLIFWGSLSVVQAQEGKEGNIEARRAFERQMLVDPATGKIPENIRRKELNFIYADPSLRKKRSNQRVRNWTAEGPSNIGGRTRALAIDRANPNVLLAGGATGGMWRSSDDGQTWIKTTGVNESQSVTAIAQDPRPGRENIWYYSTGEYRTSASAIQGGNVYWGKGVYRSTDGGRTWVFLNNTNSFDTFNFSVVHKVMVDARGNVFAATFNGVYRSTDEGNTWKRVLGGGLGIFDFTNIQATTDGVLYASLSSWNSNRNSNPFQGDSTNFNANGGLFRSTNQGNSWTRLQLPERYDTLAKRRTSIAIDPSNENRVYLLFNYYYTGGDFNYIGDSEGEAFHLLRYTRNDTLHGGSDTLQIEVQDFTNNLPEFGRGIAERFMNSQGAYNQLLKVHPTQGDVLFVGELNLTRVNLITGITQRIGGYNLSLRNGLLFRYPHHHPDNHALVFYPNNPNRMLSGHDGGISRTENNLTNLPSNPDEPVTWVELNNGYTTTQAYSVAIDRFTSGDRRMLAGFQDRGKWYTDEINSGNPWQEEAWGADGAFTAIVSGEDTRYVGTQNGRVGRVEGAPGGIQGPINFVHPKGPGVGTWFVHPFILNKNDERMMFYSKRQYMLRNARVDTIHNRNNNGTNVGWDTLATHTGDQAITAFDISKNNDANVLYYGTANGRVYRINNAHSDNYEVINVWSDKNLPDARISSIAVDPENSDNVMITYSNYNINSIFYTNDGGETWDHVGGNLDDDPTSNSSDRRGPSVRWAEIHRPTNGGVIYLVGTSVGLYSTEQLQGNNTVWTQEGDQNIGNVVVSMVEARSSDNLVAVATHGNGLYSMNLTSTLSQAGCAEVTDISANYVGWTVASFDWTTNNPISTDYTVRYRVKGTAQWTYMNTGFWGLVLTGLAQNTTYELQIKTNCNSDQPYASSIEFTTGGLENAREKSKSMITQVKLGEIDHKTPFYAEEYNDFTNIVTDLDIGTTLPLTIAHQSFNQSAYVKVWIDFNQNGGFGDKGEEVIHRVIPATTTSFMLGKIKVPEGTKPGKTRMRIAIMPQDFPPAKGAYGEVEDYTINMTNKIVGQLNVDTYQAKLFPNPVVQGRGISAQINLLDGDSATFTIFDLQGRKIAEQRKAFTGEKTTTASFGTQGLARGTYIMQVVINSQIRKSLKFEVK